MDTFSSEKNSLFDNYSKYLYLVLKEGGYPHEIICYFFLKTLPDWTPKKIVEHFSDKSLNDLCAYIEHNYLVPEIVYSDHSFPADNDSWDRIIILCFRNLRITLSQRVQEIIKPKHNDAWHRWSSILSKTTADTSLPDYFGKSPEHDISNWANNVKNSIMKLMKKTENIEHTFCELVARDISTLEKYYRDKKGVD